MLENDALQCEKVMQTLLHSPDNQERKAAETVIAKSLRDVSNARIFCTLLHRSEDPGVRQLSAVLLRRRSTVWSRRISPTDFTVCKEYLLHSLVHETNRLVRLAVGHSISTLGKSALRNGTWPQLLPTLQELAKKESDPVGIEVAVLVFYDLCETLVQLFGVQTLLDNVALPTLQHTNVAINLAGLKLVQEILSAIEEAQDRSAIQTLVPVVMHLVESKLAFATEAVDTCVDVLDVVDSFLTLPIKTYRNIVTPVAQSMLRIMQRNSSALALRHRSMMCLITVLEAKPNFFVQSGLLEGSLKAIATLMQEDEGVCETHVYDMEDEDDEDMAGSYSPCEISSFYLDAICNNVDPKHSVRLIMDIASELYNDSQNPLAQKAALLFTAIPCREYFEALRPHTELLMKTAVRASAESNVYFVRSASLIALAFHARYLQPDSLEFHEHVIPILVASMKSVTSVNIQHKVCLTMETFIENLEPDQMTPFIDVIVPMLLEVIQSNETTLATRHAAISCLSATIETRKVNHFLPVIFPILERALHLEQDECIAIRSEAVEALSVLAVALGPQEWAPLFPSVFARVQEGVVKHDFAQLREATFGFYANMAEVFGVGFMEYVPQCLPAIYHCMESEDGTVENVHPLAGPSSNLINFEEGDDEDEGDEMDSDTDVSDNQDLRMRVHQTVVDEKAAAVYALGVFGKCMAPAYATHVSRGLQALRSVQGHFDETVRSNAVVSAARLVVCLYRATTSERSPPVGLPSADTCTPEVRTYVDLLANAVLSIFRSDESSAVAGAACEAIAIVCEGMGSVAFHQQIEGMVDEIEQLLRHESYCQTCDRDGEDGEAEDEEGKMEKGASASLYESIGECIEALAKCYGPAFWPLSQKLFPCLSPYLNDKENVNECITTLAIFNTCIAAMDQAATPACEPLMHACITILQDSKRVAAGIVRNAAVLLGQLCSTFSCRVHYGECRALLHRVIQDTLSKHPPSSPVIPQQDGFVVDNCLSTLCIILRGMDAEVVEDGEVQRILSFLPVRYDLDEAENIYGTLAWVVEKYGKCPCTLLCVKGLCEMYAIPRIPESARTTVASSLQRSYLMDPSLLAQLDVSEPALVAMKKYFFF